MLITVALAHATPVAYHLPGVLVPIDAATEAC